MSQPPLTADELRRYSRHLILPDVGAEGQQMLKAASVLVIGAGGLGSPSLLYLAAAGVGTIGIADFDTVEESNLQRQIIHGTPSLGESKLDSACDRIGELNPHVTVRKHSEKITSANALAVLQDYDVVLDGSDNFPTRYLINDACVMLGKPNVYGSIFQFEGQASVFHANQGPCYRCLFRDPPPPELVPSCAEGGVFGVLPGIVGSIQALEAIKLVLGIGETLVGRLVMFDALTLRLREIKLTKDPDCAVCGANPTVTGLIDYERFCGTKAPREAEITVRELHEGIERGEQYTLIDVREHHEWDMCRLQNGVLIPLGELNDRIEAIKERSNIVFYCHSGVRSLHAVRIAEHAGIDGARSLSGGIDAWSVEIDPSVPRY